MVKNDCIFCDKFGFGSSPKQRQWFDQELAGRETIAAIPGIGGPKPGYVLLITREHESSFLSAPISTRLQADDLVSEAFARIEAAYGNAIAFEHGTASVQTSSAGSGPCIDHAHIHIMPLPQVHVDALLRGYNVDLRITFLGHESSPLTDDEYLAFKPDTDGPWLVWSNPDPRPGSQYFRRRIFELEGLDEQFDYALYPNLDNTRQTIRYFMGGD